MPSLPSLYSWAHCMHACGELPKSCLPFTGSANLSALRELSDASIQDSPGLMSLPFWQWLVIVKFIVLHKAVLNLLIPSFLLLHVIQPRFTPLMTALHL